MLSATCAFTVRLSRSRYTGKERDAESGNDYFGARYYGSSMGRFMSPDPLGGHLENPQSLNKYAYALNNPLTNTDPTGLDSYLQWRVAQVSTLENMGCPTSRRDVGWQDSRIR
jgi:RHS repeat-associated protein